VYQTSQRNYNTLCRNVNIRLSIDYV